MTRRLVYSVAASLDGFIATEDGGFDWIPMDPDMDFAPVMASRDTLVMGRGTYEMAGTGGPGFESMACYVVSTTLDPADHPDVTIVSEGVEDFVTDLKEGDGKDIWLFGGGVLFRAMLEAGLVDVVEVGLIPKLLGSGVPFVAGLDDIAELKLTSTRSYERSGMVMLLYDVVTPAG